MPISGGKDGLFTNNTFTKKVGSLITVEQLKNTYLSGLDINVNGVELSREVYQQYIDNAVSFLEHFLDISIAPVQNHIEFHDYHLNDYFQHGYQLLNNIPVISIVNIDLTYFRDEDGDPITVTTIPQSWIRLEGHSGIIRLVPNTSFPSKLQINTQGSFFPELLRYQHAPHAWQITYNFGFEEHKVPTLINYAIALSASMQALTVGGNLVLEPGIASSSINIDGLSQSIQTTQSPENSAFSATIKDYEGKLYGKRDGDPAAILTILRNYYNAQGMNII